VSAVIVHPLNAMHIFAATKVGGVFHSADGGLTWSAENSGLTDLNCVAMAMQPASPYSLLVATYAGMAFWTIPSVEPPPVVEPPFLGIAPSAALTIRGAVGRTYEIQFRTSLDSSDVWKHLADVTLSASSQSCLDNEAASPKTSELLSERA